VGAAMKWLRIGTAKKMDVRSARSLVVSYLDSNRQPTTYGKATYVVERIEDAEGRLVSENELGVATHQQSNA